MTMNSRVYWSLLFYVIHSILQTYHFITHEQDTGGGRGREVFTFDFVSSKIQIIVASSCILVFALSEAPIVSPLESTDQMSTMCTPFHSATNSCAHSQIGRTHLSSHIYLALLFDTRQHSTQQMHVERMVLSHSQSFFQDWQYVVVFYVN